MNQFNLGQFLTKFVDYSIQGARGNSTEAQPKVPTGPTGSNSAETFSQNLLGQKHPAMPPNVIISKMPIHAMPMSTLNMVKMNHMESLEKALYVKDLMNLPKDMSELLQTMQKTVLKGAQAQSSLINVNMSEIALLLQQNGKEAVNKLIMAMSNASKQGITDLSQIKDLIKLINASVSCADQNNSSSTLKSLMLLYLPWLPLQDGVGFELEIESSDEESGESESNITIMISTKNYGNIKITLILVERNSMSIVINCSDKFPKEELLSRLKMESKTHSIQSNIAFEQKEIRQEEDAPRQATVNVSNTKDVNPFLLLMAQAVIRHTIEIDKIAG